MKDDLFDLVGIATDPTYCAIRDRINEVASGARDYVSALWSIYRPYADKDFIGQIGIDFHARFWEMYLVCTLLERGYAPDSPGEGPDVVVSVSGAKIWIEAIAVRNASPGSPDRIQDKCRRPMMAVPDEQIILRYRTAIHKKFRQVYQRYRDIGRVGPEDPYVIAINGGAVPFAKIDEDVPRIVSAVFPIGPEVWDYDVQVHSVIGRRHLPRFDVTKANGTDVATDIFLEPAYENLSAILFSCVDAADHPSTAGSDFVVVLNPMATHPISESTFKIGNVFSAVPTSADRYEIRIKQWEPS